MFKKQNKQTARAYRSTTASQKYPLESIVKVASFCPFPESHLWLTFWGVPFPPQDCLVGSR